MTKKNQNNKPAMGAILMTGSLFLKNKLSSVSNNDQFESIEERLKFLLVEIEDAIKNSDLHGKLLADKKTNLQLESAVRTAKEAKAKIQKVIESVIEGRIDDKELKLALIDADRAINHIKKYLLK